MIGAGVFQKLASFPQIAFELSTIEPIPVKFDMEPLCGGRFAGIQVGFLPVVKNKAALRTTSFGGFVDIHQFPLYDIHEIRIFMIMPFGSGVEIPVFGQLYARLVQK
jgi:hypothetical protein